jgi:cardiolipin synthase A/B
MTAPLNEPASFWWWTAVIVELAGLALIPHVLLNKRNPLSALSWLWSLLLFPILGPICYLVFGTERMQRKRLRRRRNSPAKEDAAALSAADEPQLPHFAQRLLRVSGRSFSARNRLMLIPESDQFYRELGEAINLAKRHVHLEFFIWKNDAVGRRLAEALTRASARGVEVRLLLDAVGCLTLWMSAFSALRAAGGKVSWFSTANPFRQRWFLHLRNHRKLAVLDGEIAFVGGMNIGQDYLSWRDLHSRIDGPAVTELQGVFADDWFFATTEALTAQRYYPTVTGTGDDDALVLGAGPDQEFSANAIRITILALMGAAQHRMWIATPYLVPDPAITAALQLCARSGVDTRIILPRHPDSFYIGHVARAFYEDLLMAGVRIYEYLPGMLHTKAVIVDEEWSMIGSANLDVRSLKLNFELNVLSHCFATTKALASILDSDFKKSERIHPAEFARRSTFRKLSEGALRLLAPVL